MVNSYVTTAEKSLRDEMQGFGEKGSITRLYSKNVVVIPPTSTIISAVELMVEHGFRRLPVTDPGSGRLLGIIGSSDIVELLGGGEKYKLILERHGGNFLSSINDSVRHIMNTDVLSLDSTATGREGLDILLSSKRGGLVVLDKNHRISGIVTERDFIEVALEEASSKKVADYMTSKVISATPGTSLGDVAKTMVRNSFRRLPIISENNLVGMMTTRTIINFLGESGVFDKIVKNNVEEVLSTRVIELMGHTSAAVEKDADLKEAIRLMVSTKSGTVCVTKNDRLMGILTERDVIRSLIS